MVPPTMHLASALLLLSTASLPALLGTPPAQAAGPGSDGPSATATCSSLAAGWANLNGSCEYQLLTAAPLSTEIECHAVPGTLCYILMTSSGGDWYWFVCRVGGTIKASWTVHPTVAGFNCNVYWSLDTVPQDWTGWESLQWLSGPGAITVMHGLA